MYLKPATSTDKTKVKLFWITRVFYSVIPYGEKLFQDGRLKATYYETTQPRRRNKCAVQIKVNLVKYLK